MNKSEGYIDTGYAHSLNELVDINNDSFDNNCSFSQAKIDNEEDTENISEASVIVKYELLPDAIGVVLDENIQEDEIIHDSENIINVKNFNKQFINVFQEDMNEARSDHNLNDSYDSEE